MKKMFLILAVVLSCACFNAKASGVRPSFDLENQIAYQQGQFGALYARCGSANDKAVIGGSLVNWKQETFQGYKGSVKELTVLEQRFDAAANDVTADEKACTDWIKQAAATWRGIVYLTRYGLPAAAKP